MSERLTICKVDQVQSLVASRIFQTLEPELSCSVRMSPVHQISIVSSILFEYFACIPMKHYPLGNSNLTNVSFIDGDRIGILTILSWVSLRAESFARTASSVYAILIAEPEKYWSWQRV